MVSFTVNGRPYEVDVPDDTPLLWALRDALHLTGTKFGCGISQCGACTVHVNGAPVRSCRFAVSRAQGAELTTIEGLSFDGTHPVQLAWVEEQVPSDEAIDAAMSRNVCRCGTYVAIRRAIHRAAEIQVQMRSSDDAGGGDR